MQRSQQVVQVGRFRQDQTPFRQCKDTPAAAPGVRLLVVSGTLSGGGAERFASTLLRHLDRQRFRPSLCLFRDEIAYPLASDVEVSVLGHTGPLTTYRSVRRLSETIDRTKPDVVLSTMDYLGMHVGEALRICRSQPVWIARTSNNPEFQFRSLRGRLRKLWLRRVYPRADLYVANSVGLAKSFQREFPCARGRTRVLLNPVDIRSIRRLADAEWQEAIDENVPNLIFSARLRAQKRPDVLLDAFRLVLQHSAAKLWICGDGPWRNRVERMLERYRLRAHVRMVGFRDNTFPLLKAASVAVATSDYEGMPNNLLEAQALGVPVVSTRSAFGPEEIVEHGKTGLLAERGNPRSVAREIVRLLSDNRLRADMSIAARRAVQDRFCLETVMPQWESLLAEVSRSNLNQAA